MSTEKSINRVQYFTAFCSTLSIALLSMIGFSFKAYVKNIVHEEAPAKVEYEYFKAEQNVIHRDLITATKDVQQQLNTHIVTDSRRN